MSAAVVAPFGPSVLELDASAAAARIEGTIREQLRRLRRRGAVLGVSGGVDSAVCLALCARALGPEQVLALFMPDDDSEPESLELGGLVARTFGVTGVLEDVGPLLEAAGCYRRRDAYIRGVLPDYGPGWKAKLVLPGILQTGGYNLSWLEARSPAGQRHRVRLPADAYRGIVAATNMKQRARKLLEYHHADRLAYAVVGTPNRLEYDQGFFVKNGDGAADLKPIAHLYKTQVYQLAAHLGVPEPVLRRTPTTDTFPLAQTQEEFYFSLPYGPMDLCLWAFNHDVPAAAAAPVVGLSPEQIERVYRDIESKRRATRYQHAPPLLVEDVTEVG